MRYYCQPDGGQWNVPIETVHMIEGTGLSVVRALESGACGTLGNDGHMYLIVHRKNLHNTPQ